MKQLKSLWSTRNGKILIGSAAGMLFLICCVLPGIGSALLPDPTPDMASVQTQAVETALVSLVTATTAPTDTPIPTNTPVPTDTAAPTNTASATGDYQREMITRWQTYQDAFLNFNDRVQEAAADPMLMFDTDWKTKTGISLGLLDVAASGLESIPNVPPEYATLDGYMDSIASETHQMTKNYAYGLDHVDADALHLALQNLQNITTHTQNATAELERLTNQ